MHRRFAIAAAFAAALIGPAGANARAERTEPLPPALEGVDVVERLGATVPTDAVFVDSNGATTRLGDLLEPGVPVILTFNYSNCPMLCSVQLGGLVDALRQMRWQPGRQFRIVTIGIDPEETAERAAAARERYLARLDDDVDASGWVFLTSGGGDPSATAAVAEAVGFGYRYNEERNEYLHPAALVLLTPDGRVSSYQYGVAYEPDELSQAVATAGTGGTRESTARFLLSCFHFESPGTARTATRVMRWGGIGFAASLVLALAIAIYRRS